MGLANKREAPRHIIFRWSFKLLALPIVFSYVVILYLTQYLSWDGSMSLLEQHAFLLPTPF